MIWGGRAKAGEKKLNVYSLRKKKLNSTTRKKKVQRLVAEEKKFNG